MSEVRRSNASASAKDTVNCSEQQLTSLPRISRPNAVVTLDASNNLLKNLPDMRGFTIIRYMWLANNKLTDLSSLDSLQSLRELDISGNRITSLDFCTNLSNLEVLRASKNKIKDITIPLPVNLMELDLAENEITDLDFMEKMIPFGIESIDVSANAIDSLVSLRFLPMFRQLHTLSIGFIENFRDLKVLEYVKHLCPSIEYFDGQSCMDVDEPDFDTEKLIDILVATNEHELRALLSDGQIGKIQWEEPTFIEFDDEVPVTPMKELQDRIEAIEAALPKQRNPEPVASVDAQELNELRNDISELKQQMLKVAELLYVHDQALKQIWNRGGPK